MNEDFDGHQLIGPFEARPSAINGNGFEIADAHGVVALWAYGREVAEMVIKRLNAEDDP